MPEHPNETIPLNMTSAFSNRFRSKQSFFVNMLIMSDFPSVSSPNYIDYAFESDANSDTNHTPVHVQTSQDHDVNPRAYKMFVIA